MPELPEVETIRRDLDKEIVGRKVKSVEVFGARSVRRHPDPAELVARVQGRKVTGVRRTGKYLVLDLDSADVLVVHLGMSGQLLHVRSAKEPLPRHCHVVVTFVTGGQLRFVDPRTFGELFVAGGGSLAEEVPELAHLGFDPILDVMSWAAFGQLLAGRHTALKVLLTDQRFVAGIGNIYADEILFAAGLRYDRPADSLSPQEVRRLYRSMVETLSDAVKHRGSSLADEQYRDLYGEVGDFQGQHQVYERAGQACRRCRHTISRAKVNGRSTFFCERCQV
ncbi:MAG: bifunctional DNA-formamidopyrimidine glycosylase/DNA-(apurinic or apyrimidinic site) lyase [Actinomycetota bacterium]|nr:bifunctional DNA-formamidopyrimidine glycosylase/DNA-(apurinic or apyrimidinic site) lyase [Actinomycetota bacterium]